MGSNQFQKEYIEYLQERNTELIGRLNHLKENYENKILSKDLDEQHLMSTLQDMSNICTEIPQEIDLFFDKMTAAMGVLKNILLRKSEMSQLVEKISKAMNSKKNYNTDLIEMDGSNLLKEPVTETRIGKKIGKVKVSPMINGHIISTEPRIYLSRVPEMFTHETRIETHQLSPIIEVSSDMSSDTPNIGPPSLKEVSIPVERLNLNKLPFSYISEESPKSRFKGPKTWKKSLSSAKCQSENPKNPSYLENKENISKNIATGEIENADPLEGPSWLHSENEMNSLPNGFIDYVRRRHRFATVFNKNEEEYTSSCEEKTLKLAQKDENEDDGVDDVDDDDDDVDDKVDGDDEFHENYEANDDGEDFEEHNERINETSEDLLCKSLTNEYEENISPIKKICPLSKSEGSQQDDSVSVDKNNTIELKKKFTLSTHPKKIKKGRTNLRLKQSISSNKSINEKQDIPSAVQNKNSDRKRLSRSIFDESKPEMSFQKTSCESECGKRKTLISINEDTDVEVEQKSSLVKDALDKEVFVKLEDCMLKKDTVPEKSKTQSLSGTKVSSRNTLNTDSANPDVSLPENEGRKRRKAAPTFKLVEPNLTTKLRRN